MATQQARREADARRRKRQPYRKLFDHIRQACRLERPRFSRRLVSILGYDYTAFRNHIVDHLPIGTTWDDFVDATLHIDHYVPLASFKADDLAQIRQAWSLDNIRPVWPVANMAKLRSDRAVLRGTAQL